MGKQALAGALACFAVLAVTLFGLSRAWACFPLPVVTLEPRASGPPGTEVVVNGVDFNGAVEVRWNSLDGPQLAGATGPNFSTKAKIPDAPAGLYTLVVLSRAPDASVTVKAAASFEVVLPAGARSGAATPPPSRRAPAGTSSSPGGGASSRGPAGAVLALAGVGLLGVGGLAGARVGRRRPARAAS